MAIKLKSINKQSDTLWNITIEDDLDIIGYDELNNPIYRVYTTRYNPKKTDAPGYLKQKFEILIAEQKADEILTPAEIEIKTLVESINPIKI